MPCHFIRVHDSDDDFHSGLSKSQSMPPQDILPKDYTHPDDRALLSYDMAPGFKPLMLTQVVSDWTNIKPVKAHNIQCSGHISKKKRILFEDGVGGSFFGEGGGRKMMTANGTKEKHFRSPEVSISDPIQHFAKGKKACKFIHNIKCTRS